MPEQQSASLEDEILEALKDKLGPDLTADSVRQEFRRYLDYGVPAAQAQAAILRSHGVTPQGAIRPESQDRVTLADVQPGASYVNLLVRVVSINDKEITVRGEPKKIQYGIFGDETTTRAFTAWAPIAAKKGDVLRVKGAYTREYQGQTEIHLGDRVQLETAPEDAVPSSPAPRTLKVKDLSPGMSNVELTFRVLSIESREVTARGEQKTVWSGVLGDETGKAGFSSWHDFGLKAGQALKVKGGYVRSFRSTPQYTFDERCEVETLDAGAVASADAIRDAPPVALAELYDGGGALDVTVEASLVEVRPGSGLVHRCPECRRALLDGSCREHGTQEGTPDVRIKAVLDDGTGAVQTIFNRETTEALFGKTLDECRRMARDGGGDHVVEAELRNRLVGRPIRARGNVLVDEYGPTLIVQDASLVQRDLTAAAEALLAELEGAA